MPEATTPARRRPARERLLAAAARRFYADGIAATGIDTVTAEAGVAKMSLYNNFASKADLVQAYLEARHQEWLDLHAARVAVATSPQERVLAVFDAYLDHAESAYEHGFRGCGLLNAAAELPVGDPGRSTAHRHKQEVLGLVRTHLGELTSARHANDLADHLFFLLEGSMARAGLEGDPAPIVRARTLAGTLLATVP
ncbi:TetR/AcrR family transcriptional regulator [Kineococcus gynurae]|uniref:TetR/AcrR family transcriptional regulator n=1 Tax=Kineococcus gynurae TaxID=452979 RepID=A0ABV5LSG0_9ACTN